MSVKSWVYRFLFHEDLVLSIVENANSIGNETGCYHERSCSIIEQKKPNVCQTKKGYGNSLR